MTTALEAVCAFVEGNPGGEWQHFQFDALFMRDAVREVRALQGACETNQRQMVAKDRRIEACAAQNRSLIQEIERLRDSIPTINAAGAVVKFECNGSMTIVADHVEITGTVSA